MRTDSNNRIWDYCGRNYSCFAVNATCIVLAVTLYSVNTFLVKPASNFVFFEAYFNDLFAMPFILGYSNMLIRAVRPNGEEISSPVSIITLTLACVLSWEVVAPAVVPWSVADPWDVLAYFGGSAAYMAVAHLFIANRYSA